MAHTHSLTLIIHLSLNLPCLFCSALTVLIEHTDLLNPKYTEQGEFLVEWAKWLGLHILSVFLLEQVRLASLLGVLASRPYFC